MIPLRKFGLLNTLDLDEAREIVASKFCAHKLEILSDRNLFHACHNFAMGAQLAINYIHYGATVLIEPGELEDFYLIQIPLDGGAEVSNGGYYCQSDSTHATVLNPDRHTRMVWKSGCKQLLIYCPRDELKAIAEQYTGRNLSGPIVFETKIDFDRPEMARWRRHVLGLFSSADAGYLFHSRGAFNQRMIEQQILIDFLRLQPSNITQFFSQQSHEPMCAYVKKGRQYIVENSARPIALSDIAAAAHVPIRTLQHGFRSCLNKTPMEVLRHERLMRARFELASGHSQTTVTATAANWGFFHFGRFSRYYRNAFGELPSETASDAIGWRN